ncbi:MAG: hypothetical protein IT529_06265 [Burkholderiales bacterium]|nr:hypothetical protein [Burkholderiales bacterium]
MKRLQTMSIRRPDALDARNRNAAWGMSYWVRINARRHGERMRRQARAAQRHLQAMLAAARPLDDAPLPVEGGEAERVVH